MQLLITHASFALVNLLVAFTRLSTVFILVTGGETSDYWSVLQHKRSVGNTKGEFEIEKENWPWPVWRSVRGIVE